MAEIFNYYYSDVWALRKAQEHAYIAFYHGAIDYRRRPVVHAYRTGYGDVTYATHRLKQDDQRTVDGLRAQDPNTRMMGQGNHRGMILEPAEHKIYAHILQEHQQSIRTAVLAVLTDNARRFLCDSQYYTFRRAEMEKLGQTQHPEYCRNRPGAARKNRCLTPI